MDAEPEVTELASGRARRSRAADQWTGGIAVAIAFAMRADHASMASTFW
ncbi:hypothetical protein [Salmonella enterica]|nr:hypothetical protein [Salmonella enterica]